MSVQQSSIFNVSQPAKPRSFIAESRERLQQYGQAALSNTELLAILLGNSLSVAQVQQQFGGELRKLQAANLAELTSLAGMGQVKAIQLQAAFELGRRWAMEERGPRPQITCPADLANILILEMRDLQQEELVVVSLDTKNYIIAQDTVYVGNVNTSIIRAGEVLKPAIRHHATAIIIAHNHPSGDPTPSPEDVHVTEKLAKAAALLDVDILDHLIIGDNRFISLKERGVSF